MGMHEFNPGDIIVHIGDLDRYLILGVDFCSTFSGSSLECEYKVAPYQSNNPMDMESDLRLPFYEAECNYVKVGNIDDNGKEMKDEDDG